ncbi:hypothetical protein V8C37DRAFT_420320 [Trichoderma ceciliae]
MSWHKSSKTQIVYKNRLLNLSTGGFSVLRKDSLLAQLENMCYDYSAIRETLKRYAPETVKKYLESEDTQLLEPPKDPKSDNVSKMDIDGPVVVSPDASADQQVDSANANANANAMETSWDNLLIAQYIKYVKSELADHKTKDEIFTVLPTPYETWRMEKEFKELKAAKKTLKQSLEAFRVNHERRGHSGVSVRGRAQRLRSGGYGTGLKEVVSIKEGWPREGWANRRRWLPDVSYEARFIAKMKKRAFILDSDVTDLSGIVSRMALKEQEQR